MKNSLIVRHAVGFGIATTITLAQAPSPAPPQPAPAPNVAPAPREFDDLRFDLIGPKIKAEMDDFKFHIDLDNVRINIDKMRENMLDAREAMEYAKAAAEVAKSKIFIDREFFVAQGVKPVPPVPPASPAPPAPMFWQRGPLKGGDADRYYRRGTDYLDRREYDKAIDAFDRVIQGQGTRNDGAYYWKAYAQHRMGRRSDALATLAELQKNFGQSRWIGDAKILEAEVRAASGQPVSPEAEADEDLKLYAINSLLNSDPERVVPLLEKILSKNNPPRMKERALFVLAQSRSPKANAIVASFARGKSNPDLQAKAVEYLGVYGGKDNLQTLSEIYQNNNDYAVRRAVLRSYMAAKDKDRLLAAARGETNVDLRRQAIEYLGSLRATGELAEMYKNESSSDVRRTILNALSQSENAERVIEIARTEKDPKLRAYAVRRLGDMNRTRTADALSSIYASETDKQVKTEILQALSEQNSAKELIAVAKSEKDPELKRHAVRQLSHMKSKEATDYLMELIDK